MYGNSLREERNDIQSSADPFSILITEIMFDPDPQIGLPGSEYLELYNRSADTIFLDSWVLAVGSKEVTIPDFSLDPGSFALLIPETKYDEFSYMGVNLVPIDKWPALRNGGQDLTLSSGNGQIIHFATYHPSMYNDKLKQDGGWSLELADINSPCSKDA